MADDRNGRMDRRAMLQLGLGATAGTVLGGLGARPAPAAAPAAAAPGCAGDTPAQETGPFYPDTPQADTDADLTRIRGHTERASGEVIRLHGRVLDEACRPGGGAVVEVWQANAHGRYAHERDQNPTPVDPHFQGRAELVTDAEGRYAFTTVKPGPYPTRFAEGKPAEGTAWRAPHIHFRVARRGYHELVTQMLFPDEALNATDGVMLTLPEAERPRCLAAREGAADAAAVRPAAHTSGASAGVATYRFDITLRRVEAHPPVPPDVLEALVGDYRFGEGGMAGAVVRVTREGDLLYAAVVPPLYPRVELRSLGGLRFSTAPLASGTTAEFEREGGAPATAMLFHAPGGESARAQRVPAQPARDQTGRAP
jgi:protocatechuate 3,4-dioxygenase beta subunit